MTAHPLRYLAGLFAGLVSLLLVGGGLLAGEPGFVATGAVLAASMMSFFAGEVNGRRESGSSSNS